jgi:hypothetical protein
MYRIDKNGELKNIAPGAVSNYWATARQNIALLNRAKIPESTIDTVRAEYSDILESLILTYPPTLGLLDLHPDLSFQEKKAVLGLEQGQLSYTENEQKFMDQLKESQADIRKTNWKWRIAQEVEEKQLLGWYPFFVTLTLDPNKVEKYYESTEDFWKKGKEFRRWIRKIADMSAQLEGHPPPRKKTKKFDYRPESDYVTYVGVIEHGKSREHHHAHVLIWIKNIYSHWKSDPNRYIKDPLKRNRRECKPLSAMWKWSLPGLSPANYFRTKGDIWSMLSPAHGIPVDKNTGKPIPVGGPKQAAAYVTKYIQKDHKEWHHRVKATRNLGMKKLIKTMNQLKIKQLEVLSWRPNNYRQHHLVSLIHSVPLGLVRSIAKRTHFVKRLEQKQLDFQSLMINNSGSFTRMLRSVRHGVRPDRMPLQDYYDWLCQHLPVQKGYCEEKQIQAHKLLSRIFPRNAIQVQPITIGANNSEPT